jgi:D-alanyl-D-alanine carboxypeptidase (penicillin-binding protein 5/6)
MTKRRFGNFLLFLLIFLLSGGVTGPAFMASASSGTHFYRASIGPRPKGQTAPAQTEAPKQEVAQPASVAPPEEPAVQAETPEPEAAPVAPVVQAAPVAPDVQAAPAAPKEAEKPAVAPKSKAVATKKSEPKPTASAKAEPVIKTAAKSPVQPALKTPEVKAGRAEQAKPSARPASSKDLFLNVKAAILVNMSTGEVYYEHNPDKNIAPASITKLLTLYLVREALAQGRISSNTQIPVSAKAVTTGGSRMRLKKGEKVPLAELIKGISVVSANNACVAVAEYMGQGDPSKFVSQMNTKAQKIGMTRSQFRNPNGLPAAGQQSTARDIAKLSMSYLRTFPESLNIHSMTSHTYHGSTHRNANTLLRTYKGVDGLKTGFVCEAGYNITATAKRGKTRLVAVILGAQNAGVRQRETAKLLDFGFKRAAMAEELGNRAESGGKKPKA